MCLARVKYFYFLYLYKLDNKKLYQILLNILNSKQPQFTSVKNSKRLKW